ncbi:MAG: hypothetical protein WCD79_19320 [Chthoniobacteraceae bacterium]
MNWRALMVVVLFFGVAISVRAAAPMTFKEISLLVRNGEQQQYILDNAARRKLLQPLSAQEEADLVSDGAPPALIRALRSPSLLATPEMVAAAKGHLQLLQDQGALSKNDGARAGQGVIPPPVVTDHFSDAIEAAKSAPPLELQPGDAFGLSQFAEARAKAVADKKPLGFIMVWDQLFGRSFSNRSIGSQAALVHFYQAFNTTLVLVFIHHETELQIVPRSVKQGFNSPEEGGFAPNMAVVDAKSGEFIIEIPMGGGGSNGTVRDEIFKGAGAKIDQWIALHP